MNLFGKGSKLYSIFGNKCPRCHEGKFYEDGNPLNLKKLTKMHKSCSSCGLQYLLEPAFFFGATYVSYALSTGVFMVLYPYLSINYPDAPVSFYFKVIIATMVALIPVIYKLSRIVWINFFVKYKTPDELARLKEEDSTK